MKWWTSCGASCGSHLTGLVSATCDGQIGCDVRPSSSGWSASLRGLGPRYSPQTENWSGIGMFLGKIEGIPAILCHFGQVPHCHPHGLSMFACTCFVWSLHLSICSEFEESCSQQWLAILG